MCDHLYLDASGVEHLFTLTLSFRDEEPNQNIGDADNEEGTL